MPAYPQTAPIPSAARFWLEHASQVFTAQETKSEQRRRLPARWRAVLAYDLLEQDEALSLISFLDSVDGPNLSFTVYDPTRDAPRGGATVNGLVNGASQSGKTLITDGWPTNTLIFKNGDLFGIQSTGELFVVTADITSNGSGQATLAFSPHIRSSPGDNAVITIGTSATVPMRLDRPVIPQWTPPLLASIEVEMTEDLLA